MLIYDITLNDIHTWCEEKFGPSTNKCWRSVWEDEIEHLLLIEDENWNHTYHEIINSPSSDNRIRFSFIDKEDAALFRLTWG